MSKIKFLTSLVIITVSSCSSKIEYPDYSLIQEYTSSLESSFLEKNNLKAPYAVLFNSQDSQLLYIASKHTNEIMSKTFKLIDRSFKEYKPDFVIIEGLEEREGESPQNMINYIQHVCLPKLNCSEGLYAAHLANENGLNFIGAEPSDQKIYEFMKLQNYTKKDFIFFYYLEKMSEYYRIKELNSENSLIKLLSDHLKQWKSTELTYADFKNWYEEKLNIKILYTDLINPDNLAPIKDGTYLQQLSYKIGLIRDKNIVSVILKSLKHHKKVLIIYGHSHFFTQERFLSRYLGEPRFFNLKT